MTIINDILDFSKIEAGKLYLESLDFDLRNLIDDIMDMLAIKAYEKKLDFNYLFNKRVSPFLIGDPGRLRQVLINLLNNAIKFTKDGEVFLEVKVEEESDSQVTLYFSVSDTGIGIPEERMNLLFKSFSQIDSSTTRQYGGTGLGLAICKQLIEMMGGNIGVESEEGERLSLLVYRYSEKAKKKQGGFYLSP